MKVLFVCLGNICRSPTAEAVLRHKVLKRWGKEMEIEIDSAGTAAYHEGEPPDNRSRNAAAQRNIVMQGLKARQVCEDDFSKFDYIFAMDKQNLTQLLGLQPVSSTAVLKLFLGSFGTLGEDEVPDPYYGGADGFSYVLDLLDDGCEQFLNKVVGL